MTELHSELLCISECDRARTFWPHFYVTASCFLSQNPEDIRVRWLEGPTDELGDHRSWFAHTAVPG